MILSETSRLQKAILKITKRLNYCGQGTNLNRVHLRLVNIATNLRSNIKIDITHVANFRELSKQLLRK